MILTFNQKRIGQMDRNFFLHIEPLLSYWGLKWSENERQIVGAMAHHSVSITGLERGDLQQVKTLLHHTGISISERAGESSKMMEIHVVEDQPVPIIIQTDRGDTFYITPISKLTHSVQRDIHKSILCKKKRTSYSISFRKKDRKHVIEWTSYLIIQIFLAEHFSSLASLSQTEFQTGISHILRPVNPDFARLQLTNAPDTDDHSILPDLSSLPAPDIPKPDKKLSQKMKPQLQTVRSPVTKRVRPIAGGPPIDPFKSNRHSESVFNPFKQKQKNSSAVINPFQQKTYTSRKNKE